ncbi:MAG: cellulase family glycosylhydrolase [Verrucomicrobia bacterium]|nr:cellulase family glycosylhydrolase [Verrucomicrobiota bacterium]
MTVGNDVRWTVERAKAWYGAQPWMVGCNFLPSTAINQVEMFQPESFDPETIERELGWARELGFNTLRVYLHDILWGEEVREGFLESLDRFLDICARHGIRCIFVFFDDCHWDHVIALGFQQPRITGVHNSGWLKSPGRTLVREYHDGTISQHNKARLKSYIQGILGRYANDPRIVMWDIYNEPRDPHTGALLRDAWMWAREVNPSQALTGSHYGSAQEFGEFQAEHADVVSYHCYDSDHQQKNIDALRQNYPGRPIICTEYMGRPGGTFAKCLPLLKKNHVGAINWGFVNGKSGTVWQWPSQGPIQEIVARDDWSMSEIGDKHGFDQPAAGENFPEPERWFHDIFRVDGTPFDQAEVDVIRQATGA